MKIIVLGGAGDMAGRAVEDLVLAPGVDHITIADKNLAGARALASRLEGKGTRVEAMEVDALDHDVLVRVIEGHDVAASGLGPFNLFERRLVRAAVEAGVDYCSLCDEWEAARTVIEEFGEAARKKDVTVITGLGTSPGITNVAARFLVGKLDKTSRIEVSVYQPLEAGGGPAVVPHMLHIMSGRISIWRDSGNRLVKALSESREVEFPKYGKIRIWNMGHAEPETLPRFIPGLTEATFFMGFGPGSSFFVKPAQWGLFQGLGEKIFAPLIRGLERLTAGEPEHGAIRVDAYGERDGKEAHEMLCGVGQMREATGLCLSVGAVMLGRKQLLVEEGGVYAPEACIDPMPFIRELGDKGLYAYEDLAMTKRIG